MSAAAERSSYRQQRKSQSRRQVRLSATAAMSSLILATTVPRRCQGSLTFQTTNRASSAGESSFLACMWACLIKRELTPQELQAAAPFWSAVISREAIPPSAIPVSLTLVRIRRSPPVPCRTAMAGLSLSGPIIQHGSSDRSRLKEAWKAVTVGSSKLRPTISRLRAASRRAPRTEKPDSCCSTRLTSPSITAPIKM